MLPRQKHRFASIYICTHCQQSNERSVQTYTSVFFISLLYSYTSHQHVDEVQVHLRVSKPSFSKTLIFRCMRKRREIRTLQRNMHNPALHQRNSIGGSCNFDIILPFLFVTILFWELESSDLHDLSGPEMTQRVSQTELLSLSISV